MSRQYVAWARAQISIEQTCETYEECRVVRDHARQPMILDECMDSLQAILQGHRERAMDVINLKISCIGGLTKSRTIRDVCANLGIIMAIEDSWCDEIDDAAIADLAHATPRDLHFQSSAFHEYQTNPIAEGGPFFKDGFMAMSHKAGLGVSAKPTSLPLRALNWNLGLEAPSICDLSIT